MGLIYNIFYVAVIIVLIVFALSFFFESFANVWYKFHLIRLGVFHMLFSTDKKWKKPADAARVLSSKKRSKQIVFVRHGESAWNVVFNRGFNPSFLLRLGHAVSRELQLAPTMESVFFDSPLCEEGCQQALELQRFVETSPEMQKYEGVGKSVLCSSNLRRALSTGTIGFWPRLRRTQERVHVLSALQEITFNVDGVALARPQSSPVLSDEEMRALATRRGDFRPDAVFDATENKGDKPVRGRGLQRMLEFCQWAFQRDEPVIIANGHSLYFRFFLQTFLPASSKHEGKTSKLANGAVLSFTLWEGDDGYAIEEESVKLLHKDFESKRQKIH